VRQHRRLPGERAAGFYVALSYKDNLELMVVKGFKAIQQQG
jgi:hypothetical protein